MNNLGGTAWFDLPVFDMVDAMAFYEKLLGWEFDRMEPWLERDYVMVRVNGTFIGGLRRVERKPADNKDFSAPLLYFTVHELAAKAARAKELGAVLVGSRVDLEKGRGSYQWIKDREQNLVGLWGPA